MEKDIGVGLSVSAVSWSPTDNKLAIGTTSGFLCIIDSETQQQEVYTQIHLYRIISVCWSPDGTQVVCIFSDRTLCIWDNKGSVLTDDIRGVRDLDLLKSFTLSWRPGELIFCDSEGVALVLDPKTCEKICTRFQPPLSILSPNGKEFASRKADRLSVWNSKTRQQSHTFSPCTGCSIAWSPKGKRLASTSNMGISVWEPGTDNVTHIHGFARAFWDIAWSPDGNRMASVSINNSVIIFSRYGGDCLDVVSCQFHETVLSQCRERDSRLR